MVRTAVDNLLTADETVLDEIGESSPTATRSAVIAMYKIYIMCTKRENVHENRKLCCVCLYVHVMSTCKLKLPNNR